MNLVHNYEKLIFEQFNNKSIEHEIVTKSENLLTTDKKINSNETIILQSNQFSKQKKIDRENCQKTIFKIVNKLITLHI